MACNFGATAYLDSFIFPGLANDIHELDLLLFRMNKENYKVEEIYPILGHSFKYPYNIIADSDQNIYLSADIYSSRLYFKSDTILLSNSNVGSSLLFKFTKDGKLDWYHKTQGVFYKSILSGDKVYVMGNYLNTLNIDTTIVSTSINMENGFIAKFNLAGSYEDLIEYEGQGYRNLNIFKNGSKNQFIIAGEFKDKIYESPGVAYQSIGASDCFVYLIDTNGIVIHSFYFQGDSTEHIEDAVLLNNGNILIVGYTFSDTLICVKDTLFTNEHKNNYFIYEINSTLLNNSENPKEKTFNFNMYPMPFNKYLNIEIPDPNTNFPVLCKITNQQGKTIQDFQVTECQLSFPTSYWLPGIYMVQLIDKNKVSVIHKVVKL